MKKEEDKKKISQKECEIRKLADEKAELCNVIFKETSIYKKIEQLRKAYVRFCRFVNLTNVTKNYRKLI